MDNQIEEEEKSYNKMSKNMNENDYKNNKNNLSNQTNNRDTLSIIIFWPKNRSNCVSTISTRTHQHF